MADLIDRAALLRKFCKEPARGDCSKCDWQGDSWCRGEIFGVQIDAAPAVDAVEVCRCGECEWGGKCEVECLLREVDKIPDPYCAAGKRRATDG